jgi:AbiJ-like protein
VKTFSQRQGIEPPRAEFQINDLSNELRIRLWNVLTIHFWNEAESRYPLAHYPSIGKYLQRLWHDFFKDPLDTIPEYWSQAYGVIRTRFFKCSWNRVYDFVEFTALFFPASTEGQRFRSACNRILEEELSGYRFVADQIAPVTSAQEIQAIEGAQNAANDLPGVYTHLQQALILLSDRRQPDYRNSIKESISAIEAMCRIVAKNPKASLGEALKAFGPQVVLHPALSSAFDKLYGYTSDAQGIRHALLDSGNLQQEDAVFMLVSCSGFVSYLTAKCARADTKL